MCKEKKLQTASYIHTRWWQNGFPTSFTYIFSCQALIYTVPKQVLEVHPFFRSCKDMFKCYSKGRTPKKKKHFSHYGGFSPILVHISSQGTEFYPASVSLYNTQPNSQYSTAFLHIKFIWSSSYHTSSRPDWNKVCTVQLPPSPSWLHLLKDLIKTCVKS